MTIVERVDSDEYNQIHIDFESEILTVQVQRVVMGRVFDTAMISLTVDQVRQLREFLGYCGHIGVYVICLLAENNC